MNQMNQEKEKRSDRLPIATYVILGLLAVYASWEYMSSSGQVYMLFLIALSYILMIFKKKGGLILFFIVMGFLTLGLIISNIIHMFNSTSGPVENLLDLLLQDILLAIALVIKKNGVSAFRMIWDGKKIDLELK